MRTTPPEPFVLDGDWVFEQVLYREIQRVAERTLTEAERKALWQFAEKPRRRMPLRVRKAVEKLKEALGVE